MLYLNDFSIIWFYKYALPIYQINMLLLFPVEIICDLVHLKKNKKLDELMKADLHIHTNGSDGTFDTEDVIREIKRKNIGLFSVCDHDFVENSYHLYRERENIGVEVILGTEISCTENNREFHITSYAFEPEDPDINNLLKKQMQLRYDNDDRTIRCLTKENSDIHFSEFDQYTYDPRRGGWKSLNFLMDKNIIGGLPDYYNLVKPFYKKPVFLDAVTIINQVRQASGFPFLAHPSHYYGGKKMPVTELEKWVDHGISGIECYSPYCSYDDSSYYTDFCRGNNLQISGGSDCHGDFLTRPLGVPEITLDMLKLNFI